MAGRIVGQRKLREMRLQQANELKALYEEGTNRDKLILDIYTAMADSGSGHFTLFDTPYLRPQKTRDLIARLGQMNEDELHKEQRTANEALERRRASFRKRYEYSHLPPEEAARRRREDRKEYGRSYRQSRREQARLQTERRQPIQIFPQPPAKD